MFKEPKKKTKIENRQTINFNTNFVKEKKKSLFVWLVGWRWKHLVGIGYMNINTLSTTATNFPKKKEEGTTTTTTTTKSTNLISIFIRMHIDIVVITKALQEQITLVGKKVTKRMSI